MRKAISFVVGMITIISMALTAFAADYAENPSYTPISGGVGGSDTIPSTIVSDSLSAGKIIDISRGARLISLVDLKALLEEFKDKQGSVLSFESKATGKEYIIKIPIDLIKNPRALNIDLDLKNVNGTTLLINGEKVRIPDGSLYIVPGMKGDFGLTLDITFPQSHFSRGFENSDGVQLIYVNLLTGETYTLTDFIPFNEDGSVSILLEKASAYYLVPAENPEADSEKDADDKDEKVNLSNTKPNDGKDDSEYDEDYYDDEEFEDDFGDETTENKNNPPKQTEKNQDKQTTDKSIVTNNENNASKEIKGNTAEGENDDSYVDPWWNSNSGELNPPTGTVIGGTAVAVGAAIATVLTKKRKHSHRNRRKR